MAEFKLHCFAQSGNAYKAALMLELCGADWQAEFVDFFNGVTRSEDYRNNINEMGEVPVLEHQGNSLTQSGVILDYLSDHFGKFGGQTPEEKREILRWTLFDNHKVSSQIGVLRFLLRFMKTGDTDVTEFLAGRCKAALSILDKHLAGKEFVVLDKPTIADLSLCSYLYFQDEVPLPWDEYPEVNRWLGNIKSLDGWKHPYDLMPGHPLPDKKS